MRAIFGLVLVAGIALAGGAVMMAKNYIEAYQTALANERAKGINNVPTVPVYVATKALKYGERLTEEDVKTVSWPENAIPEGAFVTAEALFPTATGDQTRHILRAMEPGEPLLKVKLSEPGQGAGLTSLLKSGMRAAAIKVDVASGVSGFLRPGDRVDVYWTGNMVDAEGRRAGEVTRLILSSIELIAVDQTAGHDVSATTIARTVTITGTRDDVGILQHGQATGRLSLSLVGAGDTTAGTIEDVDQRRLLGLAALEVEQAQEKERVCTIRNRRGAEVVEVPIACRD